MSYRVWFITGGKYGPEAEALTKSIHLDGIDVVIVNAADVSFVIGSLEKTPVMWYKGERVLPPDVFYIGDVENSFAVPLARYLGSIGVPSLNSLESYQMAADKLWSCELLAAKGLPIPKTVIVTSELSADQAIEILGIPVVLKPNDGSQGIGVELIESKEVLTQKLAEASASGRMYVLQEYIATSRGRDIRVNVIDGKALVAYERKSENADEFRSNVHLGGRATEVPITPEMAEISEKAAEVADLQVAGIDLMYGKDGYVLAEINGTPGISYLPEVQKKQLAGVMAVMKKKLVGTPIPAWKKNND